MWLSCILSALGGTLFDPPRTALVIKLTKPHERGRFYSLLLMQDSAGAVLGALLGGWLLLYDFQFVCWTGTTIFIIAAISNAWLLPAYRISASRKPIRAGMSKVFRDQRFIKYILTLTGYFILFVQVMLMFPIVVNEITGSPTAIKWMYTIEAIISLTLLYPIARWSEKHFRLEQRLMTGLLLMSLAMLPIGFTHSPTLLFALISLFYLGTITAEPARETLSASLTDPHARGSYMGFSRLGHALGGAIGYIGGGWLYDIGYQWDLPALPWHLLSIIGLLTLWALYQQFNQQQNKTIISNDE